MNVWNDFEDSGTKGTNVIWIDVNKTQRNNEFARRCVFSYHPISIVKSIFYQIKIPNNHDGANNENQILIRIFLRCLATWDTLFS